MTTCRHQFDRAAGVVTEQALRMRSESRRSIARRISSRSPTCLASGLWWTCTKTTSETVRVDDTAEVHLTAYPDRVLTGPVNNIGPILEPNLRTAKVRIEVSNPGLLRVGMLVTATFQGQRSSPRAVGRRTLRSGCEPYRRPAVQLREGVEHDPASG